MRIDSEGTQFYLKLMHFVTSSYLDKQLDPEERIYRIWFVVFSFRLWRYWICCDKMYTLSENFVTLNCYLSAEINAHCLVLVILELTDRPEDFKPWHISSQPAESYFRLVVLMLPFQHTVLVSRFLQVCSIS